MAKASRIAVRQANTLAAILERLATIEAGQARIEVKLDATTSPEGVELVAEREADFPGKAKAPPKKAAKK